MFCLSKGLAAPIGSMVVGSEQFIKKARRFRKLLGGGMRQVGIIAAGGLYALENMRKRIKHDHHNARLLADKLSTLRGIEVDRKLVQTNIFFFRVDPYIIAPIDFCDKLKQKEVLVNPPSSRYDWIRMVTHYGISEYDINQTFEIIRELLGSKG
jgi:threonine aldolase